MPSYTCHTDVWVSAALASRQVSRKMYNTNVGRCPLYATKMVFCILLFYLASCCLQVLIRCLATTHSQAAISLLNKHREPTGFLSPLLTVIHLRDFFGQRGRSMHLCADTLSWPQAMYNATRIGSAAIQIEMTTRRPGEGGQID